MYTRKQLASLSASVLALAMLGVVSPTAWAADDINVVVDDVVEAGPTPLTTSPKRLQPEPTVAIDPANPNIIAAGAQDFRKTTELNLACGGNRWNGLYISYDGGTTWEQSLVPGYFTDPVSPQGTDQDESEQFGLCLNTDPVIVFDGQGNLFYSHVSFNDIPRGTSTPSTVGVLYASTYRLSDDGKYVHAKTVKVPSASGLSKAPEIHEVGPGSSNFDDKQWMTVDRSPESPHFGRVYVTWTKFGGQGGQSSVWLSHCGGDEPGQTCAEDDAWADGVIVNKPVAGGLVQESFPATAPDGTVYVGFLQFQGGFGSTRPHSGIWIAKSTDGGATFTQTRITPIRQIPSPIPPQGSAANDGLNSFRTGTVPSVATTPNAEAGAGHSVHVVWGEWIGGQQADVRYSRSTDGGATWETPSTLNDVSTGHQFFPSMAANDENVHVAWLDSRMNSDLNQAITDLQVAYTTFADGGAAGATDTIVSDQPFNPNEVSRFPVFCQAFIGDYIDIDVVPDGDDEEVAIIWSDNRTVGTPLDPDECAALRLDPAAEDNQPRLNDGSLDQDAFVELLP
jgi:hypothetical protein